MITEDYVSFETALLLKKKGFEQVGCRKQYNTQGDLCVGYCYGPVAPTLQMAMKWLREVHNICITIYPDKEKGYEAVLYNIKDDVEILLQSFGIYGSHIFEDSYEQAAETSIKYCLENLI